MDTLNLQPEVAAKYDVAVVSPGRYIFPGFGEVDLCALNVATADGLVARGFTWLKLKPAPEPVADKPAKAKVAPAAPDQAEPAPDAST